jgi:twitching motility protein PilI
MDSELTKADITSTINSEEPQTELQDHDTNQGELYLRFTVPSGNEFALPASGVREVVATVWEKITPIPNVSPFLLGTFNWRGLVIWIADLGQFLGDQVVVNTDRHELSLLIVEELETVMGFVVQSIASMEWLDVSQLTSPKNPSDIANSFIRGEHHSTDQTYLRLLDQSKIVRSSRWSA